ncbi:MAG: methyltransferase domain-containing protein [Chloroflexi bacterium]|nr:methyltransferase domain-containing protein [Chloroflexota bacterium]
MTDEYESLAPFYDLITDHPDDDVDLFAAFARRIDAPVLELGVGTGRVAIALAERGLCVHGIDRSAAMLDIARRKAVAAGVSVALVQSDLADFRLEERFGLIFCAADSFLHLTEAEHQLAALRRAAEHLAPGGRLILDLPSMEGANWLDWAPGARPVELVWSGEGPHGRFVQHMVTFTCEPSTQTRSMTHILDEIDANGQVRRTVAAFDLRFIFPAELPLLVAAAGLRLERLYGGYDLAPFGRGSARMIAAIAPAG